MLWSAVDMNSRVIVAIVGAVTVLLGLGGLLYPESVMRLVGYGYPSPPNIPGTLGEVRAVYGGMLIVAGAFTLLAASDPRAHQGRLLLLGLLWIGAAAGRLFGVLVDGNPGLLGWLSVVVELGGGGALLYASQAPEGGAAQEPATPPLVNP
jgi:protein-S-isoprenylcysteine O-methyltransferase Ste14